MEMIEVEISVVIPVYCSEGTLLNLYERLTKIFEFMSVSYEVIMVDDSSKDNSWKKLKEIHEMDQRFKIIRLAKNFGQINAILCGFSFCKGKYIITMDDDLQHPPEEIPKLYNAIIDDPEMDVILGNPVKKRHNIIRNLGTLFGNIMNTFYFKKDFSLKMFSFRLLKKNITDEMIKIKNPNFIFESTLLGMTKNIKNVLVEHHPRKGGKSTYSTLKLIKYALNQVFTNAFSPLKIVSFLGISISIFSVSLGLYYLIEFLKGHISPSGWTSLMVTNLFLFGVVLLSLGIIGEYLIRIMRTLNSQQYIITQKFV